MFRQPDAAQDDWLAPTAMFPPRISNRPFFLELLGVALSLAGGLAILNALIVIFKTFISGSGPGFGLQISEVPIKGVAGIVALPVVYAIWKERGWGRPAIVAFVLLVTVIQNWLESASVASIASSALTLSLISWYLYLWPNASDYYRRLRESGEPPNSGLPADT